MCSRFNLRMTEAELQEFFDLFRTPAVTPRYNVAPRQLVLTISAVTEASPETVSARHQREGRFRSWGLVPRWAKDFAIGSQMLNARSESAAEKPAFRSAFQKRRCIIPASGFYEWETLAGGVKQPWHVTRVNKEPLAFAGLWESWENSQGEALETCTILTTDAIPLMADLNDRMPVLLTRDQFGTWLDPDLQDPVPLQSLLVPCPPDWLTRQPVNRKLNNVKFEGPECLEPAVVQGRLF